MSERIRTPQLGTCVGRRVTVAGWLHARRRLGGLTFTLLRDGWGICQLVSEGDDPLQGVENESVVAATGTVVAAPEAPGGVELRHVTATVISPARHPPLVLGKREMRASLPTQLDLAAISLRHPARRRIFQAAARAVEAFRETMRRLGFTEVFTPKVMSGASEGGANVFVLDYFGRKAFLAQSPQLYKQVLVGVFERVFEVGPVFRAEPHETSRHLNQYTSLDAEMGFITDHRDVMAVTEEAVSAMVAATCPELPPPRQPFPTIPFWEAQEVLRREFGRDRQDGEDLSPQDERELARWAASRFGSEFVCVTGYPLAHRPFYTHPDPLHPGYTRSFDLLFRGLEIVTGGQRLHRHEEYLAVLEERGLPAAPLEWYLLAFRHGMPPHGGFAIGLERFVAQLLGLGNVREAALFPRDLRRLQP